MKRWSGALSVLLFGLLAFAAWQWRPLPMPEWTGDEVALMQSLSLNNLPPLPPDPSNAVADNPRAARFGHALFFDPALSGSGHVACTTCHVPERNFTDGRQIAQATGRSARHTPSIVGTAYSPWLYWDGRRDSQWAQALSPLEDPAEHAGSRTHYAGIVFNNSLYLNEYKALFGDFPDISERDRFPTEASPLGSPDAVTAWRNMAPEDRRAINTVFANLGKAIAAYERKLLHGPARFDHYVAAVVTGDQAEQDALYSVDEAQGLKLFLGKARCTECHNGPLLTNNEFHNNGVISFPREVPDEGRSSGLHKVLTDPFNCLGDYSDDPTPYCGELEFARDGIELIGAFRTPSLRNIEGTEPFMHKGQLRTLRDVLELYNDAPLAMIGHNEVEFPLSLTRREIGQLEAFLHTLASPVAVEPEWLRAPAEMRADAPAQH